VDLKPEAKTDAENASIARENAQTIADHLQSKYAEEVFGELPASDQKDPVTIGQKSSVIVCGKPADPNTVRPEVMLRDWFDRGANKRLEALLLEYAQVAQAAAATAINQRMLYGKVASGARQVGGMLRALISRSDYMMDKYKYLAGSARTQLAMSLRSQQARHQYQIKRAEKFKDVNKQMLCGWILSTINRQKYYEAKLKYLDWEMREGVAEKMRQHEQFALEYISQREEEVAEAKEQQELFKKEEEYMDALKDAAFKNDLEGKKQKEMNDAAAYMEKARGKFNEMKDMMSDISDMDDMFDTEKGRVMMETMKQALIEHGKAWHKSQAEKFGWAPYKRLETINDIEKYHPPYRAAPVTGELRAWREYLYGPVACEQMEQLDAYQARVDADFREQELKQKNAPAQDEYALDKQRVEEELQQAQLAGDPEAIARAHRNLEALEAGIPLRQSSNDITVIEDHQLSPASKRYLSVALDCNQNPDDFEPAVQAALKRCVAGLLNINTRNVRIG